jgi:NhaP-type Na+/H+ or K+/H+ antiporter
MKNHDGGLMNNIIDDIIKLVAICILSGGWFTSFGSVFQNMLVHTTISTILINIMFLVGGILFYILFTRKYKTIILKLKEIEDAKKFNGSQ